MKTIPGEKAKCISVWKKGDREKVVVLIPAMVIVSLLLLTVISGMFHGKFYSGEDDIILRRKMTGAVPPAPQDHKPRCGQFRSTSTFTTSFFAGAGDGDIYTAGRHNWSDAHDDTTGDAARPTDAIPYASRVEVGIAGDDVTIMRAFWPFDTSGLPDDANITAACLYLYGNGIMNDDDDGDDYIAVVQTTQANTSTLTTADYNAVGSVDGGHEDIGNLGTEQYNAIPLNEIGLTWISTMGITKLGTREGHDLIDDPLQNGGNNWFKAYSSEEAGTSKDPYLEVTYTVWINVTDMTPPRPGTILFLEDFEDTNFSSRGWYDALRGTLTTSDHIEGSTACLECRFLKGERGCEGGTPGRHLFNATDEVYVSYYVKYSTSYTGSNKSYHPHEFHFLTTENSMYVGPAYTHLTTYIEHNEGVPLLAIQDGENIDESNITIDLTGITEERAVAGGNGDSDGYGEGHCYLCGKVHCNGKQWRADGIYFQDEPGHYYKNDWHFIEAYFKLNSIVNGTGVADGHVKYWYDGQILIDHEDVMLRTGQHPDMKFNQFLMAPYIGDGSPVEQTMWVDNLTIATSRTFNQRPTAIIESISPNPAYEGELIWFYGNGTDDGTIEKYYWNSSIDGFLSTEKSFSFSNLSNGTHTIYFKVKDDSGVWSEPAEAELEIIVKGKTPERPFLEIIEIIFQDSALENQNITIEAKIRNTGNVPISNFTVIFYYDDKKIETKKYEETLGPSEETSVEITWQAVLGNHTMKVKLETTDGNKSAINESDKQIEVLKRAGGEEETGEEKEEEKEDKSQIVPLVLVMILVVLLVLLFTPNRWYGLIEK